MRRLVLSLLLATLVVTGCGSDDGDTGAGGPTGTSGNNTDLKSKPSLDKPAGDPPKKLETTDIVVGTGAEAKAGNTVSMQYVGWSWSTDKQFDASWDRNQPFEFQLGSGFVIKGWDQGIAGMKVGGRRRLVIPPDLGYGDTGAGDDIKPGETLIFIVDLLSVK